MQLSINGVPRATASSPVTPLLTVLREEFNVTSAKPGCEQGGCGACTVLVDGQPRRACLVPIGMVGDADVMTVEGMGTPRDLTPIQAAFNDLYAAQCGYCTSGMLMAAQALIGDGEVSREQVLHALSGHVCRCTGYVKIVDAVLAASAGRYDAEHRRELDPDELQPEVEPKGAPA